LRDAQRDHSRVDLRDADGPSSVKRMKIPIKNPKSPMRLTTNALRPAEAFFLVGEPEADQ